MGGGASKEEAEARRRAEERRRAKEARQKSWQAYGLATLQAHANNVTAVASYTTQAGAVRVVSGSDNRDRTVRIWEPDTQRLLATLQDKCGALGASDAMQKMNAARQKLFTAATS